MASDTEESKSAPVRTGARGLDEILRGGLPRGRVYLLYGTPGSGKTTLALQFLRQGVSEGERVLYVPMSESVEEVRGVAASHGWDLSGVDMVELAANPQILSEAADQTIFRPSDVELTETFHRLVAHIEASRPHRLVVDSMAEFRLLAGDGWSFRLQLLRLKHYLASQQCTTLLLDTPSPSDDGMHLESLVHGVLRVEFVSPEYGPFRRKLRVQKMRGVGFVEGDHDLRIVKGGLEVYPRLVAAELHEAAEATDPGVGSGVEDLDTILGGGLDRGSTNLVIGPTGVGKSILSMQYAIQAARRGEKVNVYLFDERVETVLHRSRGLGHDLRPYIDQGLLRLRQIDPAELSAGEFSFRVREAVETHGVGLLVIDSLNGYENAMVAERSLQLQMHELQIYLGQHGVTTILAYGQHGLFQTTGLHVDISYLTDTVILLRYYEFHGSVRRALSVFKRRASAHEATIRDYKIGCGGIFIGRPLTEFQGVLTGNPTYTAGEAPSGA